MTTPSTLSTAGPWRGLLQVVALVVGFFLLTKLTGGISPNLNPAITGFVLVLVTLLSKAMPLSVVEQGANILISRSALFLIPAVVAVAREQALLAAHCLALVVIVFVGTVLSAIATAIAVEITSLAIARRRS